MRTDRNKAAGRTPREKGRALSVGFVSLGCAKNLVDSQVMAGSLLSSGLTLARSPEEADVVLVNTCSFIKDARNESYQAIEDACRLKRRGPCKAVVVTGCLPQRYGRQLLEQLPDVDAFVGLDELDRIGPLIRKAVAGAGRVFKVAAHARRLFDPDYPELVFTGGPFAYLKIAEGCNHRCAFCAIPAIRGAYRSRPEKNIVAEAEKLLACGVRELNLISQDTSAYGTDLGRSVTLASLVRRIAAIGGDFWIRLLYLHPSRVTDDLLETIAATRQVCKYLDVPVQHSHPDILSAMRRGGTATAVADLPARIRKFMPDAALRTTCIVGFPGETPGRFAHLLDYVRAAEFDHLGVFTFSPEDGTPAFDMPGAASRTTAEKRRDAVMTAQYGIVSKRLARRVGTRDRVLLEAPERGGWTARSAGQAPDVDGRVIVKGVGSQEKSGRFADVRYIARAGYDMKAVLD